jgi:hypothetical protein
VSTFPCPCGGSCDCHGGPGAFRPACNVPGGCGSLTVDRPATDLSDVGKLCVLGCRDRRRTDLWPRPPRPRDTGLLTCRACADRILLTLDEVLELTVLLDLVLAAGSAPRGNDGGRKRIKDEPVAPVPVSLNAGALTDVRSSRGTWVPAAPPPVPDPVVDDDGAPVPVEQLVEDWTVADRALDDALQAGGPDSEVARAAATQLSRAHDRLRRAALGGTPIVRSISPTDNDPASVIAFIDRWTDRVRVGRELTAGGPCPAWRVEYLQLRTGPFGRLQDWPRRVVCDMGTEYRRLIRFEAGIRTTGLFAVCSAGHVTRPVGQGDLVPDTGPAPGHRPTAGIRHGQTVLAGVGMLRRHNEWICSQPWVTDYWRALRALRADLGQAHGELRPSPIGNCPNGTGLVDEHGREIACGEPLFASGYSDTIECSKCGRTWDHRQWRLLGRTLGVIA